MIYKINYGGELDCVIGGQYVDVYTEKVDCTNVKSVKEDLLKEILIYCRSSQMSCHKIQ